MNPEHPIQDIMRRTMTNLEFIESQNCDVEKGPFEVTQLVNSFLGAFALPLERYSNQFDELSLEQAFEAGWPRGHGFEDDPEKPVTTLAKLLWQVRHALAHGNVAFYGSENGDIETIELWSRDTELRRQVWRCTYTVNDLRKFLECLASAVERLPEPRRLGPR